MLDNLHDTNSRSIVEAEYLLQKPFQVRWNAVHKSIEYYILDPKHKRGGWGAPDGEVYAEALEKHEESHIRRERLNASSTTTNPPPQAANTPAMYDPFSSGQFGPYPGSSMTYGGQPTSYTMPFHSSSHFGASSFNTPGQTNTAAIPNPQTAREIELAENLIKLADGQIPAVKTKIDQVIETFRRTATGEEYNLNENQIEALLGNYRTLDIDISRNSFVLGIPSEYLMRMAQLNEGERQIGNISEAIRKVIDRNLPFFENHKSLTDFGITFERRASLLEPLHQIRELQTFSQELNAQHRFLGYHVDYLQKRKVSSLVSKDWTMVRPSEDNATETLKLLIESSPAITAHIQRDEPLLSTIESLASQGLPNEEIRIDRKPMISKFIDSANLLPDRMLWLEDNPPREDFRLNNDIAVAPPFIDSAAPLVPKSVNRKIFQDLLEVAPEDLKKYFSADEENSIFTIHPEIFAHVENSLTAMSKKYVLKLIESREGSREFAPAEREALADARFKLKGLKALSRICRRWPDTKDYQEISESIKKEFGEFLLTTAVDTHFRETNNTQFITALGACGDQVLDAVKALKTGHTEYQEEKGNLSAQQSIQFRIERARLETLGRVANLEIYAKLKKYARLDEAFQEVHIKQTLEVKVGEKLNMTTTPRHAQYHDPDIKDEHVDRALQIIDAMERGDKVAAAKHLTPLIQAAEEGIQKENERIKAKNVELETRGEQPLPLEKPLSADFKDVNTWSSERELLLADESLEFGLRKETAFSNSFAKRKADVDEKGRPFEDIPDKKEELSAWKEDADQHGKLVAQWAGDLVMSLVQISKAARTRVHEQLSENPQETYTVHPVNGLIIPSEKHPTAVEDFYRSELEIAKETHPSLKNVTIDPACEAEDKQKIWFAAQLQLLQRVSIKGYTPQPADHESLAAVLLVRQLKDMPLEKISEHFNTTAAKPGERLGDLFTVKTDSAGNAWIKPEGESSSLVKVNAADIKGLPLKAGQKTPVDFLVGELKWSNANAQDNLDDVGEINKKIETRKRERERLERFAGKKTASSSAGSVSDLQRLEASALNATPIDPEKQYNQLLFLQKSDDNKDHLFAAVNQDGEEELRIGNLPSTEQLNPGDVFSFNKGAWERETPALTQSQVQAPISTTTVASSSSDAKIKNLDENELLAGDRAQLEKDIGLPKGILIEFSAWNGKNRLTDAFASITPNGAYMKMQVGQSATPRAALKFISNEQLQQLGLLHQNNQRTEKGETFLQKNVRLPKDSQQLPQSGRRRK
ncbi:MAG: NEL-type E3 ubiquitin ligase domain-containing protein [Pseudomonadota bacterium]